MASHGKDRIGGKHPDQPVWAEHYGFGGCGFDEIMQLFEADKAAAKVLSPASELCQVEWLIAKHAEATRKVAAPKTMRPQPKKAE